MSCCSRPCGQHFLDGCRDWPVYGLGILIEPGQTGPAALSSCRYPNPEELSKSGDRDAMIAPMAYLSGEVVRCYFRWDAKSEVSSPGPLGDEVRDI